MRLPISCLLLFAATVSAQTLHPPYFGSYNFVSLGRPPGVPLRLGGITFKLDDPGALYIGGGAASSSGAVYRVPITRNAQGHITGYGSPVTKVFDAPNIDGGLQFGSGGVAFFTRYPLNELGQVKPNSTRMDKSVPLTGLGVASSVGALSFVPAGFPHAGKLKLMSYTANRSYTATLRADANGTYDVSNIAQGAVFSGGPEGFFYVPPDSPQFVNFRSMLICEYTRSTIAAYDIDANGDPVPSSRRLFMTNIGGCEGAGIDPISGDFLFSTYNGGDRVVAVRGFGLPCGRVIRYGQGSSGTGNVVPTLDASGCFARRQRATFSVTNGRGGASGVMITGLRQHSLRILGIDLLVAPFASIHHRLSGTSGQAGAGAFALSLDVPDDNYLLNTDFFFQGVYLDPGASQGFSATGGLKLRVR